MKYKIKFVIFLSLLATTLLFQNCSSRAGLSFTSSDTSTTAASTSTSSTTAVQICNPLTGESCTADNQAGLSGKVYYFDPNLDASLFAGNLAKASLDDYFKYGRKVEGTLIMSQVNVSPRSWDAGFAGSNGQLVQLSNSQPLLEWFAIDISGYIQLPSGTQYQIAQVADDGMRVMISGAYVLNDDGAHVARYQCSSQTIAGGSKLPIRVNYFQGPRYHIAMQLLIRPAESANLPCDSSGNWQEIPASAYSH